MLSKQHALQDTSTPAMSSRTTRRHMRGDKNNGDPEAAIAVSR